MIILMSLVLMLHRAINQLYTIGNMVMLPFSKSATTKMAKRAIVSGLNSI